ncbi:MAG: DMT family transporter [Phycisphaerae bacterium]|nr:DMT family transporter [Phycisphaerae bacterium]
MTRVRRTVAPDYQTCPAGHIILPLMESHSAVLVGYAAGVATAMLWTATSLFFNAAARRLGVTILNTTRIAFAIVLLGVTHRLLNGYWLPDVLPGQAAFLAISGLVGLTVGDQALFSAFRAIGPRLAMLVMTSSPLWAALFGWTVLGERLAPLALLGMAMTIFGIVWVVLERPRVTMAVQSQGRIRGCVLALVGAICQAGGLLLSKQGMGHGWLPPEEHIAPQTATLVRMTFAGLGMIPLALIHHRRARRPQGIGNSRAGSMRSGLAFAACGAVVGPFLGVWMSLVASDRAPLGIAQTLCSMTPIFLLPFAAVLHGERITARSVLGVLLAVGGTGLIFTQGG